MERSWAKSAVPLMEISPFLNNGALGCLHPKSNLKTSGILQKFGQISDLKGVREEISSFLAPACNMGSVPTSFGISKPFWRQRLGHRLTRILIGPTVPLAAFFGSRIRRCGGPLGGPVKAMRCVTSGRRSAGVSKDAIGFANGLKMEDT